MFEMNYNIINTTGDWNDLQDFHLLEELCINIYIYIYVYYVYFLDCRVYFLSENT